MSGDQPTPSGNAWTHLPKKPNGHVDKPAVKAQYDASKHVEWTPFCEEFGYDPNNSRRSLPFRTWVADKRRRIEEKINAEIGQVAVEHRATWIKDVKHTLEQYPKAVDNVMFLVARYMKRVQESLVDDPDPSDLLSLAAAVKTCIEAKKSILLLNEVVVKLDSEKPQTSSDDPTDSSWTMSLKGDKNCTPKQLTEAMTRFLDTPTAEKEKTVDATP